MHQTIQSFNIDKSYGQIEIQGNIMNKSIEKIKNISLIGIKELEDLSYSKSHQLSQNYKSEIEKNKIKKQSGSIVVE